MIKISPYQFTKNSKESILSYDEEEGTYTLTVSSSSIKRLFFKNSIRDICNTNYYWCNVLRRCKGRVSDAMLRGQYFETQILGCGAAGSTLYDLPRHKKTGEKLTDHVRIDELIHKWDQFAEIHQIIIIKEGENCNVQRRIGPIELDIPELKEHWPNVKVLLKMDTDIISPIFYDGIYYDAAVLDLKLTQSLNNKFGEYCWGSPEFIDHIQAFLYSYFTGLPFFYLIGDYKDSRYEIMHVNTNREHPDEGLRKEAELRYKETIRRIIDFVDAVMERETKELWYYQWPSKDNCKTCLFNDRCKSAKQFKVI